MRKQASYVNHLGETIDLFGDGIHFDYGKLADWEWAVQTLNGRISSLRREQRQLPISIIISSDNEEDGRARRDRLFEVMEKDCLAMKPGKLYVDGWYVRCYVVASSKEKYWYTGRLARYELTLLADDPVWTKEHTFPYAMRTGQVETGVDFPYDFPYDFGCSINSDSLDNPSFMEAPARIVVYGPAEGVSIGIGGNQYNVDARLATGELLIIDGLEKTIVHRTVNGFEASAFHLRRGTQRKGSGSYVFEPIKPGYQNVSWDGSYGFDVTLYEQRGERRWGA